MTKHPLVRNRPKKRVFPCPPSLTTLFVVGVAVLFLLFLIIKSPSQTPSQNPQSPVSTQSVKQRSTKPQPPTTVSPQVLQRHPHDAQAFTQGLVYLNGAFYESTGLHGRSSLRLVDPESGALHKTVPLPQEYFGEGIAILNDTIFMLTWRNRIAFSFDMEFKQTASFPLPGEGWGLTDDGSSLILSDGSDTLFFLSPTDFTEIRRVKVRTLSVGPNGKATHTPVRWLNELEWVGGYVFANVYMTDSIAVIDPATGLVKMWLDMRHLRADQSQWPEPSDVLNGIAFDKQTGRLFVTGKLWPHVFEISNPLS